MINRYGGLVTGKRRFVQEYYLYSQTDSKPVSNPAKYDTEFDYTSCKGMWNLNSSYNFYKSANRPIRTGLSRELDSIGYPFYTWTTSDWQLRSVNIDNYANLSARVVFKAVANSGLQSSEIQVDNINVSGNIYSFENTGQSFETTTTNTPYYETATWTTLTVNNNFGRWVVDTGNSPAGICNPIAAAGSYYIRPSITDASGTFQGVYGYTFWLRSPVISLGAFPMLTYNICQFFQNYDFNLFVYLDVQ